MRPSASLTEGSILRALITISIPIVLSNMLQTMYQVIDTFWVGRLSADAVAAVSLSFPITFLLIAIGGGLPIAGTVLIAQYKGKGDNAAMNHVAAQTLMMVIIVSLLLSGIGYMFSEPIMRIMGASPEVLPDAVRFLQYTFIGFVFVFGFFAFESLMRGLGEAKMPMYIVLLTVILNAILDPLFIFGYGPIPAMGVAGAAMATTITQAIATFIGIGLLLRGKHEIHLKLKDFKPDPAFIKKAFFIGLPSSIEQSTRALGMTAMTILVASFGTLAIAAYGIGMRMLMLVFIPAMGLSIATSALVGQNIGAGKVDRAAQTNYIGSILGFAILSVLGVLLFATTEILARFFVPEGGEAIAMSAVFVRIMALTFGFIGLQMIILGTLRGAGDTKASMNMTLISQWVIQFPLALILSRFTPLGLNGIWWSFSISNIVSTALVLYWFRKSNWKSRTLVAKTDDQKMQQEAGEEARIDEGI
jgi:putative MATE family efflux protein